MVDVEYKNSSDTVAAHWHGFTDTESGINSYHWCVGTTPELDRKPDKTECDVMGWRFVGLQVSASANVSYDIPQGKMSNLHLCLKETIVNIEKKVQWSALVFLFYLF